MKIKTPFNLRFAFSVLIFSLLIGETLPVFAAPQPVIEDSEIEQLRALPFSISSATSLIVRSRQVASVASSGAGSSSPYGFAQEGGISKEVLWLRFHNAGSESWSHSSVEFTENFNVSRYNSIVIWVRALQSGQRFLVTLQDKGWKNKLKPQANTPYFPLWGLPQGKILQVVVPFKSLNFNSSVDFARLTRIGFQYGTETAGNKEGDIIEVLGMAFVQQPDNPTRIHFVDLTGKIEKQPSPVIKAIAPKPTPFPKPVFKEKPVAAEPVEKPVRVAKKAIPRSKTAAFNFATHPTYFQPVSDSITAFRSPSDDSQTIAILEEGKAYLGLQSQKVDKEVWFLLDIDPTTSAWVPSSDVEFATRQ